MMCAVPIAVIVRYSKGSTVGIGEMLGVPALKMLLDDQSNLPLSRSIGRGGGFSSVVDVCSHVMTQDDS
jgi:hypothetical protein